MYILKRLHNFIFVNKEWNFLMAHENSLLQTRLTFNVINVQTAGLMTTFSVSFAGYCQGQFLLTIFWTTTRQQFKHKMLLLTNTT